MTDITVEQAVNTYIKIRDAIATRERELKDWKESLKAGQDKLEKFIRTKLEELGLDSVKAGGNTAFLTFKDSVTISDKQAFKSFLAEMMLLSFQGYKYKTCEGGWQPYGEVDLKDHIEALLDSGAFDLLTVAANKNNCKDHMESHKGLMPPGVDYTKEIVIQIRKGNK